MNRMKTVLMTAAMLVCVFACTAVAGKTVYAAPNDTIQTGISADGMDLSGMTQEQAQGAVQSYVDKLGQAQVQLQAQDGQSVSISLSELGISWKNPELVSEAVSLGKKGNIVARYKAEKDLQNKGKNYPVVLDFDKEAIRQAVTERCSKFNVEAIDAHLTRVDGSFQIEDGQTGYVVDENASVAAIYDYLTASWVKGENGNVALVMAVDEPKGKTEELAKVKDVLGTFTTSYSTSGASRSKNVANGCSLINGTTLYPGDTFSTYNTVKPFSTENGYEMAGSYLNGKVVDSIGGGICQVSTTLYNAVLREKGSGSGSDHSGRFPAYRCHQRQQRTYWLQGKTLEDCKGKRCGSQPGAGQQQQLQDEPQNGNRRNCFSGSECDQPDAGGHCDQQH